MKNKIENDEKNKHKGHRQRLRQVIEQTDVVTLPEHQVLELLLSFVIPHKDVNPLAHDLLNEFGSLTNVFETSPDNLVKVKGIGEVAAYFLNFCSKIPEIYKHSKANAKRKLETPNQIIDFLKSSVDFSSVEQFYYICLNSKGDVLSFKKMGTGSISQLYVNNRELVQQILKYPTHTVVLCHTHPHGVPTPSDEDIAFTATICDLLDSLSIRLCDHVILSPDGYYSFFQNKMLGSDLKSKKFNNLKMGLLFEKGFEFKEDQADKTNDAINFIDVPPNKNFDLNRIKQTVNQNNQPKHNNSNKKKTNEGFNSFYNECLKRGYVKDNKKDTKE